MIPDYEASVEYLERKLFEHRKKILVRPHERLMWNEDHWRAWRREETAIRNAIVACQVMVAQQRDKQYAENH